MTVAVTRLDLSARDLRASAARSTDAKAARRMLAIALVMEGSDRAAAARSCGMDRQTLRDWVYRYNAGGLAGLSNRTAPGRTPYLSAAQKAELSEIVRAGPDPEVDRVVRWRRIDLKHLIKERFGVVMHERTVGKQLAELGFRRLSVRPAHPQSDPAAQAAFKKKLRPRQTTEIWFQDEAMFWMQQGTLTFCDIASATAYIFGAVVRNAPLPPPSSCPLPIRRR